MKYVWVVQIEEDGESNSAVLGVYDDMGTAKADVDDKFQTSPESKWDSDWLESRAGLTNELLVFQKRVTTSGAGRCTIFVSEKPLSQLDSDVLAYWL